jgi:diaminohydroxyphosphoribosylaminopyrimidine deaminase/5-amino-6-(5-phosphoribosylamino)uracil reductase
VSDAIDRVFMARALELAARARFQASPNPHVGCVLVRDGVVIGEGFTRPAGGPHAEPVALAAAGDAAGATAYLSLEPCNHQGRTGPCSEALLAAGIARVVYAMADPNPAAGGGGERLRAAGVVVEAGLLESEARALNVGFCLRMARGRGRVRAKLATSLDGRTAMASGESQWITGPAARADVQRLRAASCAILTGVGTVLADDCALTVREAAFRDSVGAAVVNGRQPLRVVLDSQLRTPVGARVLAGGGETLLLHGEHADGAAFLAAYAAADRRSRRDAAPTGVVGGASRADLRGDQDHRRSRRDAAPTGVVGGASRADPAPLLQPVPAAPGGGLDLQAVMAALAAREVNEILVESGPRLVGALLAAGLLDELIVYQAPCLLGSAARPLLELPLARMADKVPLALRDQRRVGDDWRFIFAPVTGD